MDYSFEHTIPVRKNTNDQLLIDVLNGLLTRYIKRVPAAKKVIKLMSQKKDNIVNDHIAFRSINICSILKIFTHLGYEIKMDATTNQPFDFKEKKLTAVWLKHPNKAALRVFVSQFRFKDGSTQLQELIQKYLKNWTDPIESINLNNADEINKYLHTAQWETPTYKDYKAIQKESEYVSWVLYNKYYLNHFTLTVNKLDSFKFEHEIIEIINNYQKSYHQHEQSESIINDCINMLHNRYRKHMIKFNHWLMENKFILNAKENNYLNISPDNCLLQSSTKSDQIKAEFTDGVHEIPGSYVEFAYRAILDTEVKSILRQKNPINQLENFKQRDGFEVKNADKIFESTYMNNQDKNKIEASSSYIESCNVINKFINEISKEK